MSAVFGHRDLNVILGPMSMDGVVNLRRGKVERGSLPPMSWPPPPSLTEVPSNRADRITSTGVPMCRYHAQVGNYRTVPINKVHRVFCAVHED